MIVETMIEYTQYKLISQALFASSNTDKKIAELEKSNGYKVTKVDKKK